MTKREEQLGTISDPERPRIGEHLYQEPQTHEYGMDPEDGLPRLKTPPMDQTLAPPYSPDRFVCGESDVLVDESGNQYEKEHVNFDESSRAYYYEVQSSKEPSGVRKVHLKPLRPRCKHYKRQLVPFEGMSDRKKMIRLCTAAMNQNGEYYSLEDSEVLACEFRDPPDRESARRLEEFEEQLRRAQEEATVKEDDFDPENALGGGIFGS